MSTLFWFIIGYCVAILFPVPWLSPAIINAWSKVISWFKGSDTTDTTTSN